MSRHNRRIRAQRRRQLFQTLANGFAGSYHRLPHRFRSLHYEPLEARLPLAAEALQTDVISWQGNEVEVHRGQWIVQVDEADRAPDARGLSLGPLAHGTDSRIHAIAKNLGRPVGDAGHYLFEFGDVLPPDLAEQVLSMTTGVRYAEPNFVLKADVVPNDPDYSLLWGLNNASDNDIDAPEAWDLTTGSSTVVVGVIDSGVDYTHEDLAANMWTNPVECPAGPGTCIADGVDDDGNGYIDDFYGWDFANDDNDPFDDHSHGTHVAGTIAAVGNNGVGVVGVNWQAQIMALKFITSAGTGSTTDAIEAIEYATKMKRDHGVNISITNNSWGGGGFSQAMKDAIAASGAEDMLFIASAGNDAKDTDADPHYPSSYDLDNIISVASTTGSDGLSSFSNTGLTHVDLGAPGSSIWSTEPFNQYDYKSGTSMASPHVAGAAALVWAADPSASRSDVRNAILSTVDPISALQGKTVTGGRLNAHAALQSIGMFVSSTSPAQDELLSSPPTSFTLHFSDPFTSATVDAADLQVNGISANSVTLDDADSATFQFSSSPVTVEGLQTMTLAAGSITRASDSDGVAELTSTFFYDATPLQVVSITPADGGTLVLPDPVLVVDFNEPIAPGSIDASDLQLSAGRVESVAVLDADTAQYNLTDLTTEQPLTVTLAAGAVRNPIGYPSQPFAANYDLDFGTAEFPADFSKLAPSGSLIRESAIAAEIDGTNDTDTFLLSFSAGEVVSIAIAPGAPLAASIRLLDPTDVEVGSAAGSAGQEVLLSLAPLSATGTYQLVVEGDGATTGTYDLDLVVAAHHESESHGGSDNGTLGGSQDVSTAWADLSAPVRQLGVRGQLSSNTDVDWFEIPLLDSLPASFTLDGAQTSTIAMTLHAADGTQLAASSAIVNADQQIADFEAPSNGSYFLRVSGDATPYTLTVTEGASFDAEPNERLGTPQDIDDSLAVVGHIGGGLVGLADVPVLQTATGLKETLGGEGFSALAAYGFSQDWLANAVIEERENGVFEVVAGDPIDLASLIGSTQVVQSHITINSAPEGDMPRDVVFTNDGTRFLVVNRDSGNVLVYDAATRAVVGDIAVSGRPVSIALSPNGNYALTANTTSDSVSVINLNTLAVETEITTSRGTPYRVKVTPDGQKAVVATEDGFVVLSMTTFQEVESFYSPSMGFVSFSFTSSRALPISVQYQDFAITPDSQTLVVPDASFSETDIKLRLFDIGTGAELAALDTLGRNMAVTITQDGTTAYVANEPRVSVTSADGITKVDLVSRTVTQTWPTETLNTNRILLTDDEQFAIVEGLNKLLFIDLADGSISFNHPYTAKDFALSYDGKYLITGTQRVIDVATQSQLVVLPYIGGQDVVAASPTNYRAASVYYNFGADVAVFNIDGVSSAIEDNFPSGAAPEGDSPIAMAISPDGQKVVTANFLSNNAAIVDLGTGTVSAWIDTGAEPDDVAITPDGNFALLTSPADDSLTIIDLNTNSVVATLTSFADDPRDVLVSLDGNTAFVTSTGASGGLDRLYFVDLSGATSSVAGSIVIGDIANETTRFAEMALSPDGSVLAVPASRDDQMVLVDTATRAEITRLSTGGMPTGAVFNSVGDRLYTRNSSSVTVIRVDGASSSVEGTIAGLGQTWNIAVDDDDQYLYVSTNIFKEVLVVDTTTRQVVKTIDLPNGANAARLELVGNVLYVEASHGVPIQMPLVLDQASIYRMHADGPASQLIDETPLSGWSRAIEFNQSLQSLISLAYSQDGLDLLSFETAAAGDRDSYEFTPQVGDSLTITAAALGPSAGPDASELRLAFDLYAPNGDLLAQSDNGQILYTVAGAGAHVVEIYAGDFTDGEYLLSVAGVTQIPGPSVDAFVPIDGATDLSLTTELVVTFDEPVASGSGNVQIMRASDDSVFATIPATSPLISIAGSTVTIDPGVAWEIDTEYYVLIDAGAIEDLDGIGFAGISDKTLWNFSIGFGHDFGDAPLPYPVTIANGGAHHQTVDGSPRLGSERDSEVDGTNSPGADFDDLSGLPDDEDGVTFGTVRVGQNNATVTVHVQSAPTGAKLDAWIDLNHDGTWGGPLEQIADSLPVSNGDNIIEFDVPSWASATTTYARFRISTDGDHGVTGYAGDGEVEDHPVTILSPLPSSEYFGGKNLISGNASSAQQVIPIDLDGDGDNDVISPRGTNGYLVWHENDGSGGFTEHTLAIQSSTWKIAAGDMDGDGDIDVLSSYSVSRVAWHENLGNGNFDHHVVDTAAGRSDDIFAVDMDNDGDTDIVVLDTTGDTINWYQNDGTQSFTKNIGPTGVTGVSMFVIDVDGDGDHDFVSNTSGISWYENDGGTFTQRSVSGNNVYRLAATDVDGDGDTDVIAAAYNQIAWYENDGSESFTWRQIIIANQAYGVYASDLDGDGDVDFISDPIDSSSHALWHENDGAQNFTQHLITTDAPSLRAPTASDLDGDGDLDILLIAGGNSDIAWYENQNGVPPQVVSLSPADDQSVVAIDANLVLTFDKNVQAGNGSIEIRHAADDSLFESIDVTSGAVSISGAEVTVNPTTDFNHNTEYYVLIGPNALNDGAGNKYFGMESDTTWNFTTFDSGIDYGDAPDSGPGTGSLNYNTVASDGGPSHIIVPGLFLGQTVDADDGTLQNARADADDADPVGLDDENSLISPATDLIMTVGSQPRITLLTTNLTGAAATLSGWIDYNNNGVFELSERAQAAVADGSLGQVTNLTFPTVPVGFTGETYARFRLGSDAAAADPTGASLGGEVEDYPVEIFAPSFSVAASTTRIAHQVNGGPTLLASDYFGAAIAPLGDLNGDGVPDMAISAVGDDEGGSSSGAIYIALMNADGSIGSSYRMARNTDNLPLGYANEFGHSLAPIGDLDRDGVNDLAALTIRTGGTSGASVIFLYLNADGTLKNYQRTTVVIDGDKPNISSMTAIGDVDGNGVIDLAFGAPLESSTGDLVVMLVNQDGSAKGYVTIADQLSGGPDLNTGDQFGTAVAPLGDLDGDGIPDLAVSAERDDTGNTYAGAVYVLFLNADGTVKSHQKIASETGGGPALATSDLFGSSLNPVGDLNGDGVTDLMVGATGVGSLGGAFVLLLNADGTVQSHEALASGIGGIPPLNSSGHFGSAVTSIGDLDGNGTTELAVSANWEDEAGIVRTGAVYVLFLDQAPVLSLAYDSGSISENGGSATATVTRLLAADLTQPLTVNLASSDTSEATVPASVIIPANETSVDFTVNGVDDDLLDGSQFVTVTGSAAGFLDGVKSLTVLDHETLTLAIAVGSIAEDGVSTTATVTRSNVADLSQELIVNLASDDTSEVTVPATVTIAAGQATSPSFNVSIIDDSIVDGTQTAVITASAGGYFDGTDSVDVIDNDTATLTVSIAAAAISENGGSTTATVTRNADLSNALTVNLTSSDPGEATVPVSVVIPAGQSTSPPFAVDGVDDLIVDGTQTVTVTASATAYPDATDSLDVTDDDVAALTVSIADPAISENGGTTTATVSRNTDTTNPLTVDLLSSDVGEATVPGSVTIAAGQTTSAPFTVTAVDDAIADGTQTVAVTASATAHADGIDTVDVTDDEVATLTVAIVADSISENGGVTTATVSRNSDTTNALTVMLGSSDTGEATVPVSVTIAAGQSTSAPFNITAVDDAIVDGTQTVTLTATAAAHAAGTDSVDVSDDDVAELSVVIVAAEISENGGSTTATVSRNTDTGSALTVNLTSSDTGEATVPASVTIAAGQTTSASFAITAVDDLVVDGTQTVTVTATAAAHADGTDTVGVTDDETPELTVTIVAASISENGGSTTATVSRNSDTTNALTVNLVSSDTGEATVPASIVIPAGQATSAAFTISAVDDLVADGTQTVTVTATAAAHADGADTLDVTDDEAASLIVTIVAASISENGGSTTATVSRNSETTNALTVSLASSDTGEATVPASVTIAAGQTTSPAFTITAVDDLLVDGTQTVTVTASAASHDDGADTVDVTDDDVAVLTLTIVDSAISENGGTANATVSRNTDTTNPLTVTLSSSDTSEATVPASITIPAGQATSATFTISGVDDPLVDGTQTVTVTASAVAHADGTDDVDVEDDDVPELTVVIVAASISEADGPSATTATVTRNYDTANPLTVELSSDDTTEATVPASITIPAGQITSSPFAIDAVDDALVDGTQTVTITASVPGGPNSATPDATFGTNGLVVTSLRRTVSPTRFDMELQPDGKILAYGVHPTLREAWRLIRLNSDGSYDSSFGVGGIVDTEISGSGTLGRPVAVEYFADGRIAVLGLDYGLPSEVYLARYTSAGALDTTFDGDGILNLPVLGRSVYDFAANPDGSIWIAGASSSDEGFPLLKINEDGSIASTTRTNVGPAATDSEAAYQMARQPDGKLVVASNGPSNATFATRFNSDGSLDTGFGVGGTTQLPSNRQITDIKLDASENILVASSSYVANIGSYDDGSIVRLTPSGTIDTTFSGDGVWTTDPLKDSTVYDVEPLQNGQTLVLGAERISGLGNERSIWRLNADGTLDTSFDDDGQQLLPSLPTFWEEIFSGVVEPDGDLITFSERFDNFRIERFIVGTGVTVSGSDTVDVTDDDTADTLTVTISAASISENGGTTTATVSRDGDTTNPLTVSLSSNDTGEATVPASIVIAAGQTTSAAFTITAVDDAVADGTQTVTVTAAATGYVDGTDTLDVTDDEIAELTVTIVADSISENGGTTTATVTRNTDTTNALTVNLSSSDTSEATVPASVIIAAGQTTSPSFTITAVDDATVDGTQTVTVTATATAHADGTDSVDVSDDDGAGFQVVEAGEIVAWSGSGASGTDPYGTPFISSNTTTVPSWGMPGFQAGTTLFQAPGSYDGFRVSFSGLPNGVTIFETHGNTVMNVTPFSAADIWDKQVTGDSILFTSPDPVTKRLDQGDSMFVSVLFTGAIDLAALQFDVEYIDSTNPVGTVVDESGTTDTFTVVLTAQPQSNVVIDVTSGDLGEATVDKAQLTFTNANWDSAQTVTVTGVDDALIDGDQTTAVTLSVNDALSDDEFDPLADQTVSVTTLDDEVAPVVSIDVSPMLIAEDGSQDLVYTLSRTGDTSAPLTVNFTTGGTADSTTDYTASHTGSITFAAGSATASVTVDATPDTSPEDNETVILTIDPDSTYIVGSPDSATGTILDNDIPGVGRLVGVDLASGSSPLNSPTNWNTFNSLSSADGQNLIAEDGTPSGIDIESQFGGGGAINTLLLNPTTLPIHAQSLAKIDGTYSGTAGVSYFATFSGLEPGAGYRVYVFGSTPSFGNGETQNITISGAGGSSVSFSQTLTTNDVYVNRLRGSDQQTLESYAEVVTASSSGVISVTVTPNAGDSISLAALAIQQISAPADPFDFGDAPTAAQAGGGTFVSNYPVTAAEDGARHAVSGPTLGPERDSEPDGTHSAAADADDTNGGADDEDGVTFSTALIVSSTSSTLGSVSVDLQNADSGSNRLDAWIDFNRDGDWDDSGEQVFTNFDLGTTNGTQVLPFTIPQDVGSNVELGETYARFRLSTAGGLAVGGAANDGEVEDHTVTLSEGAKIEGVKWNDVDGDGVFDAGESGLPGWTIFLDQNQNRVLDAGEPSGVTDANGNYSFAGLNAGTYYLAELPQAGWQPTFPANVLQQETKLFASNATNFSSNGTISQYDLDGSNRVDIITNASYGFGLDDVNDKLYWSSGGHHRSDLDGLNAESIAISGRAFAFDAANDRLFFSSGSVSFSADLATLTTTQLHLGLNTASDIEYDPVSDTLFVVNNTALTSGDGIYAVPADGSAGPGGSSSITKIISLSDIGGVAVDSLNRKLYYTNASWNTVYIANLDGTDSRVIVDRGRFFGDGEDIEVIPELNLIVWRDAGSVYRAKLDGSDVQTIPIGGPLPNTLELQVPFYEVTVAEGATVSNQNFGNQQLLYDFGDAPSKAQTGFLVDYPVTVAQNGAQHFATGPTLGSNRDIDTDGVHSIAADADDTTGSPNDEDGIVFSNTTLLASTSTDTTYSVDVTLQNADPVSNRLDAWIDFDRNGIWLDTGEQIFDNFDLGTTNGTQTLTFTVPQDTGDNVELGETYARFRLSTAGDLFPTTAASDGEVEDYRVTIAQTPGPNETLTVDVTAASVSESDGASATTVTVTRDFDVDNELTVDLFSDDTSEATVPSTVTIPAGQTSAAVNLDAVDDLIVDGTQTVTITATLEGARLDSSFGSGGIAGAPLQDTEGATELQADGKFVSASRGDAEGTIIVTRHNSDGTLDATFGTGGVVEMAVSATTEVMLPQRVLIQSDGKILVGGRTGFPQGTFLVRLNADGTADSSYGNGGIADLSGISSDYRINDMDLTPDGKVLAAVTRSTNQIFRALRVNANGTVDSTFGTGGILQVTGDTTVAVAIETLPDGKFILVGSRIDVLTVVRANADGSLDTTFGDSGRRLVTWPSGFSTNQTVKLDPLGRVVIGATHDISGTDDAANFGLVRLTSDGDLDTSFDSDGIVITDVMAGRDDVAKSIEIDADGKIWSIGYADLDPGNNEILVVRYNTDGSIDTSFDSSGVFSFLGTGRAAQEAIGSVMQPDGSVVILAGSDNEYSLARVQPNVAVHSASDTVDVTDDDFPDVTPPTVVDVIFGSSGWDATFIDAVDGGGLGAGNGLGISLVGATQLDALPWPSVDRIYLVLSEDVSPSFADDDVAVIGTESGNVALSPVGFSSVTNIATIPISNPLSRDRYVVSLSAQGIQDPSGNVLDGEWANGQSDPSGDGTEGGQFDFFFNVLQGDANGDGSVNVVDLPHFSASFNRSVGSATYNARADWNTDGTVNVIDLPLFSELFNRSLPLDAPNPADFGGSTEALQGDQTLDMAFTISRIDDEDAKGDKGDRMPPVTNEGTLGAIGSTGDEAGQVGTAEPGTDVGNSDRHGEALAAPLEAIDLAVTTLFNDE